MAGSYGHVTDDEGRLVSGREINSMLECMSGDVVECIEEMYGMIWYLAERLQTFTVVEGDLWVEEACQNYREGLAASPGQVET